MPWRKDLRRRKSTIAEGLGHHDGSYGSVLVLLVKMVDPAVLRMILRSATVADFVTNTMSACLPRVVSVASLPRTMKDSRSL